MAKNPQIRAIVGGLNRLTEKLMTRITLDVTANLIETTPVDTGWARANWVPAIGVPFVRSLSDVTPSSSDVSGANSAQQAGQGQLLRYKLPNGKIFVTNNVPYITKLNDGSSPQAPSGFVQRAITKAVTSDIKRVSGTTI